MRKNDDNMTTLCKKAEILSQVGVKSIYTAYLIVQIILLIDAILSIISGIIACKIGGELVKTYPSIPYYYLIIVGGIITIICSPLLYYLLWLVIKPFIARLYDMKLIRYKLYPEYQEETMRIIKNEITVFKSDEFENRE